MTLGGTIEEAKQRLSYGEALQRFEYRQDHGGIGAASTNRLLALIALMLNRALGGEATFEQIYFAREKDATLQDIMNELGKALS